MKEQGALKFRGILFQLLLLVLIPVIPAVTLAFYHNLQHRKTEQGRMSDGVSSLSRVLAASLRAYTKNTEQLLGTVAEFSPLVLGTNAPFSNVHLENLLKISADYVNFGLAETNGVIFAAGVRGDLPVVSVADRAYFQRVVRSGQFAVGGFQTGRLTGKPSLNFGLPVRDEAGQLKRVFFAAFNLEMLTQAAREIDLPEDATALVVDRDGMILTRLPNPEKWVGKPIGSADFGVRTLSRGDELFEADGLDGIKRLFARTTLKDSSGPYAHVVIGVPKRVLFSHANRGLAGSLAILAAVTAIAMSAAYLFARRVVADPVNQLISAAEELAAGNLSARAQASRSELAKLSHAFNRMADKLAAREEALRRANSTITELNTSLEKTVASRTAELQATNEELEAFTYSVSHDLRAPLRHLDGFAQLLSENQRDRLDEKGQRHLKIISDSAKKMGVLIDELLSFSRMGRKEMLQAALNSNDLVREAINMTSLEKSARPIEWRVEPLPEIRGDLPMIRQVWLNLLSNAVKYSAKRESPVIEIGARDEAAETVFFVKDNGAGFDMRYADKLFGVFQRLHHEKDFEGTGIGLANVRRIVTRHGGRTWAESVLGQGATFYFSIPKA